MANIKSAKKRIKVIERRTLENKLVKSKIKSASKNLAAATDKVSADAALVNAMSTIDKAHSKGVLHRKTASRKISRLAKKANKIEA